MSGPGNDDGRPPPGRSADAEHVVATTSTPVTSKTGRCCDSNGAWRRRREASRRLPLLHDGAADPWRPWRPEHISDVQAQGAIDAAHHLLAKDLLPLFDADTITAIGRSDDDLAKRLYDLASGDFA